MTFGKKECPVAILAQGFFNQHLCKSFLVAHFNAEFQSHVDDSEVDGRFGRTHSQTRLRVHRDVFLGAHNWV